MGYSYDDFLSAARNAGMEDSFSEDDLMTAQLNPEYGLSLLKLQKDYSGAKTAEQKLLAQEAINQLRGSYGRRATNPTGTQAAQYQTDAASAVGTGGFVYNPDADPNVAAARKRYLREGQRAMEDTLAAAAANTGGVPSTAAITAAQQANDYYSTQFEDALPQLEETAYQRYLNEIALQRQERELQWQEEDRKIEEALRQYQLMGYATEEVAKILGIPYDPNAGKRGGTVAYYTPTVETEELQAQLQAAEDALNALRNLQNPKGGNTDATPIKKGNKFSTIAMP
jgi:hypothetical protein